MSVEIKKVQSKKLIQKSRLSGCQSTSKRVAGTSEARGILLRAGGGPFTQSMLSPPQ